MTEREQIYLKFFTDGNVSLDYMEKIQVRDRILKSDAGKMLEWFPNFLTLPNDFKEDIYDSNYYSLPAQEIRTALTNVINYIRNSLFAQDIATLSKLSVQFEATANINNDAKQRLINEQKEVNLLTKQLEDTLLEAKKIFTVYDMVIKGYATAKDPVEEYTQQVILQYESQLAQDSAIKAQLEAQKKQQQEAQTEALNLSNALETARKFNEEKLAQDLKNAEIAHQKAMEEAKLMEQNALNSFSTGTKNEVVTTKKTSAALPLAVGAGILGLFIFGRE